MPPSGTPAHPARKSKTAGSSLSLPLLLSLISSFSPVASELVNVTVDDQLGDRTTGLIPEYLPNDGTWHVGSPTEVCSACKIKPSTLDLSQILDQTWHDATHSPSLTPASVTVHFNGSAVYVFNILPNKIANTTTFVNISFSIDGADAGSFTRSPDSTSTILYNQLVYRNVALQDGPHTLVMTAGGRSKSLILFDYLLYTTQSKNSTASNGPLGQTLTAGSPSSTGSSQSQSSDGSSMPVGAIVGGVVGGVVILLGIVVVVLLLRRRTMRSRPTRVEPRAPRRRGGGSGSGSSGEYDGFLLAASTGTGTDVFSLSSAPSMRSLRLDGHYGIASPRSPPVTLDSGFVSGTDDRDFASSEFTSRPTSGATIPGPHPAPLALVLPNFSTTPSVNASAAAGAGPHPTPDPDADLDADLDAASPSTARWSAKRRAELTRRLETLQRTRSILSSGSGAPYAYGSSLAPSMSVSARQTEFSMGSGTQRAIEELEVEIAELRGVLADLSARLAGSGGAGDGRRVLGPRESLPAYAE
ncbi:hypothetical protein GSI_05657 [Ganoderma sinense ZZ0214-1]|uniref:Transporter n=1 Tax=Ganoderma sinense ZZ0214-1 TaxID=1077348 RepID=A0A2G8SF93_9APHY|nr:hypothetical protein GSI_05657 [Ganoderma sinense ZZ0214-1]